MTTPQRSKFGIDEANDLSLLHRDLGNKCKMNNIDGIESHYQNDEKIIDFIVEWKSGVVQEYDAVLNQTREERRTRSQYDDYIKIATALQKPFFLFFHFLDNFRIAPMIYVVPACQLAMDNHYYLDKQPYRPHGEWMTPLRFSKWRHQMRGLTWNPNEPIEEQHIIFNNHKSKYLKDLYDIYHPYKEPHINLPLNYPTIHE